MHAVERLMVLRRMEAPQLQALAAMGLLIATGLAAGQPAARCAPASRTCLAPVAAASAAAPRKKNLADVLRERESRDRESGPRRPFARDGAEVLRDRMGAV